MRRDKRRTRVGCARFEARRGDRYDPGGRGVKRYKPLRAIPATTLRGLPLIVTLAHQLTVVSASPATTTAPDDDVRYVGQFGEHLLTVSFTARDPFPTFAGGMKSGHLQTPGPSRDAGLETATAVPAFRNDEAGGPEFRALHLTHDQTQNYRRRRKCA